MTHRDRNQRETTGSPPAVMSRGPLGTALLAGGCALIVVLAGALALVLMTGGDDSAANDGVKRAVILDQLSLTQPNPDFISQVRGTLAAAGYTVEYIAGEDVTVDIYRSLPDRGYDLVILRVHAGITTEVNEAIDDSMQGDFGGALILMMGCDGLRSQRTAEAFLNRGASAFVSWSKPISASHTDMTTEALLQRLLIDDLPVEEAVAQTAAEVGPDPVYEGELRILGG